MSETASARWRRWDPAPIQPLGMAGADPAHAEVSEHPCAPTAVEIERMTAEARQRGHDEGWAVGERAGQAAGFEAGERAGRLAGHETGRAEGFAKGLSEAREQGQDEIRRLRDILGACATSIETFEVRMGAALIDLAIDLARQVVRGELTQHPALINGVVTELLHASPDGQPALKIWLHPDDLALVDDYLRHEHGAGSWRLFADANMVRGGCRAESVYGAIDATLPVRWQRVTASLGRDNPWCPA